MMKKGFIRCFVVLTTVMVSCGQSFEPGIELVKSDYVIEKYSDTEYFSRIESMQLSNNLLYAADYELNKIFIFDTHNDTTFVMGSSGRGPGELLGPMQIFELNDTLVVYSDGKFSIDVFVNKKFIKTINLGRKAGNYSGTRFFMRNNKMYFHLAGTQSELLVMPVSQSETALTTLSIQQNKHNGNAYWKEKHILPSENSIIGVGYYYPEIVIFDYNGEQVSHFDFSGISLLEERMIALTEATDENSSLLMACDACLYNDKIYILVLDTKDQVDNSNKILVFDSNNINKGFERVYELADGWYSSITVSDGYLWAYNSGKGKSQIERFNLK
jgi:hypothetical protein